MKKKALGKSIPDILKEQDSAPAGVFIRFPGIESVEFNPSEFDKYWNESPEQRAIRLNNELQGCF